MKHLLIVVGFLSLTSCARAYVREWGGGKITTCCPSGNLVCNRDKLDELAKDQCGGSANAVGGGLVTSGAAYQGYGTVRNTSDSCVTYQCGQSGPAPASK